MSRKLQAEVDKLTKEVNTNLEAYDTRWQELKDFNRSQLGLKERMWEEARREQIRGKKHAVRTATLELLDFKHVCDSKGRIETELETILRRLHRHKQQLAEWSCAPELRQQADELRDLRKQVELRYKRGRVFYCRGESSEGLHSHGDAAGGAETTEEALGQMQWLEKFLVKLRRQREEFEEELRDLRSPLQKRRQPSRHGSPSREIHAREARRTQLQTFMQLHDTHCQRLAQILHALSTQGYEIPADQANDLRDQLHQYVDNNDNLEYVVAEDIYMDLVLPTSTLVSDTSDSSQSTPASSECLSDEAGGEQTEANEEFLMADSGGALSCSTSPLSSSRLTQEDPQAPAVNKFSGVADETETKADTNEYLTASLAQRGKTPKRLQEIVCIDAAVCDWSFHNANPADRTLPVRAGDILYVVKVDKSGWSYAFRSNSDECRGDRTLQQGVSRVDTKVATPYCAAATCAHRALSPKRSHIDSSCPDLISGWFPNHVRKSVHDWTLDQASTTASEASAIVSAAAGGMPSSEPNLMDRLQNMQNEEAQVCCANLAWLLNSLTAHIRPQSVCIIQWDWSQSWELGVAAGSVRYLDVSKGDRVWVLRVSPAADWVEVRKLDEWECISAGWVPATNLVSPKEIVDNMILLDNITAPLPSHISVAPLRCYERRRFLVSPPYPLRSLAIQPAPL